MENKKNTRSKHHPKTHLRTHPMKSIIRGFYPVVIDIETTGLDAKENGMLEISAVLLTCDENKKFKILEQHDYCVKPHAAAIINPKALEINKIDLEAKGRALLEQSEPQVLTDLFAKIKKQMKAHDCRRSIMVAHNSAFDQSFLHESIRRCSMKNKSPFHPFSSLDTVSLGALCCGHTVLSKICSNLKMDFSEDKAHSASYDALKTAEAFCLMMNDFG